MGWAERLTRSRALIEAELDFADEDDVPGSVSQQVWEDVGALYLDVAEHIEAARGGEIVRDGYKVVLVGPPNAGKSSLLNALAQREVAIVTHVAGTTRDILSVDLDLGGYLVRFFDTAGLRETDDLVEQEGVRRARHAAATADMLLHLNEIDSDPKSIAVDDHAKILRIGTKLDQHGRTEGYDLCLSAETGEGLDQLKALIIAELKATWSGTLAPSRARHLTALKEASNFIAEALNGEQLDLRAESLRLAASALGRITGRVDVEQLLDVIFSQFCIGK